VDFTSNREMVEEHSVSHRRYLDKRCWRYQK
jgi:hypothetical protein